MVYSALSKAGFKVGHVDANPYYGGDDASLSVDELIRWADERTSGAELSSAYLDSQRKRFTHISYTGVVPPQSRQYAVSLCPTLIPSIGPLIDSLIASGVSRYGGFKLLEQVAVYESTGVAKPVPGNKEDVFKSKELSLLQKRRLMRFLIFAGGDFEDKPELQNLEQTPFPAFLKDKFSLDDTTIQAITYALSFCVSHEGGCVISLTCAHAGLMCIRPYASRAAPHPTVSAVDRTIWSFTVPCRTLRRNRGDFSRVLQNGSCCWSNIHPGPPDPVCRTQ